MAKKFKNTHISESIALLYLRCKGYRLLKKNFTVKNGTGAGEIDLIMKKGKTLVFVEVKKRKTYLKAAEAIDMNNQLRLVKSSAVFLKKYPNLQNLNIRYDAILFKDKSCWPKHLKDAWRVL